MTRGDTILDIRKLTVRAIRGGRDVVENVSFTVAAGETVCVVGESGSGKSVTAMSVMGLLAPGSLKVTGGSVVLDGETVTTLSAKRLQALRATHMGMVFQEPMTALNPVQTVGRQVDEVLRLHRRMDRAARRAAVLEMFASVHLPDPQRLYNAFPHQLSGGQRQRIMIAMALVLEPKLLIADEPTTALDVTTQKEILRLIKELQTKHGTSVLFITHDMGVVADIADRVCVMHHGDIVETAAIGDLLERPTTAYTRKLLSSVPSLAARPPRPMKSQEIVLEAIELNKTYSTKSWLRRARETHAAADVNFTLRHGRTLGIVGESGSGKSTVARCIMR
ncbi:ATP-binding cassette domain-containing protein, partial [Agrobacterium tumefaciens]|uniref:ATP-binding cassette domain-containing protein n=1 Tax=Agrobacterium tumefaciens TaxID=358 RepID=UPI003B9E5D65